MQVSVSKHCESFFILPIHISSFIRSSRLAFNRARDTSSCSFYEHELRAVFVACKQSFEQLGQREVLPMSQTDWAKIYAEMNKRIVVKYEQLPKGEQIAKCPQAGNQQAKSA
jgi:hypothetical protein